MTSIRCLGQSLQYWSNSLARITTTCRCEADRLWNRLSRPDDSRRMLRVKTGVREIEVFLRWTGIFSLSSERLSMLNTQCLWWGAGTCHFKVT